MQISRTYNERNLLYRLAEGHEPAFRRLYEQHRDRVYGFALSMLRSEPQAEEVVQDVFLRLWQQGRAASGIENLHAWLRTLTRNHTLKVLRRRALELRIQADLAAKWDEGHNETEELLKYRDLQQLVEEAIGKLPAQQRKVYTLCHVDGLTYEEAAAQLELSKLTVQTHMKQALKNIRSYLTAATDTAILLITLGILMP